MSNKCSDELEIESAKRRILDSPGIPIDISINKVASQIKEDRDITGGLPYLTLSLTCQITKRRIFHPVKYLTCKHAQCFELEAFLRMIWVSSAISSLKKCPHCNTKAKPEDLRVDDFFTKILHTKDRKNIKDANATLVKIFENGEWELVSAADHNKAKKVVDVEADKAIDLDEEEEITTENRTKVERIVTDGPEVITLDDEEDENEIKVITTAQKRPTVQKGARTQNSAATKNGAVGQSRINDWVRNAAITTNRRQDNDGSISFESVRMTTLMKKLASNSATTIDAAINVVNNGPANRSGVQKPNLSSQLRPTPCPQSNQQSSSGAGLSGVLSTKKKKKKRNKQKLVQQPNHNQEQMSKRKMRKAAWRAATIGTTAPLPRSTRKRPNTRSQTNNQDSFHHWYHTDPKILYNNFKAQCAPNQFNRSQEYEHPNPPFPNFQSAPSSWEAPFRSGPNFTNYPPQDYHQVPPPTSSWTQNFNFPPFSFAGNFNGNESWSSSSGNFGNNYNPYEYNYRLRTYQNNPADNQY